MESNESQRSPSTLLDHDRNPNRVDEEEDVVKLNEEDIQFGIDNCSRSLLGRFMADRTLNVFVKSSLRKRKIKQLARQLTQEDESLKDVDTIMCLMKNILLNWEWVPTRKRHPNAYEDDDVELPRFGETPGNSQHQRDHAISFPRAYVFV
ncbi:hypothetical protein PIB30_075602 [Stylosanthes scabra]|uniref:Uncharacterized protein n=1 Tax=Stylosanthes scabra TaxID=79078 RepID=A0ABU6UTQ4_9FABA|nr:hypothetical protein [Stylosanthes scabra]